MSEQMVVEGGGKILSGLSASDPKMQSLATSAYGLTATLGRELPHSRLQESEADRVGLLFMARAGYNPEEAVHFWERFAEFNRGAGGGQMWFLRTHPLDEKRIQALKQQLPAAMAEYNKSRK
jgi:predicted Zn-dependent protease